MQIPDFTPWDRDASPLMGSYIKMRPKDFDNEMEVIADMTESSDVMLAFLIMSVENKSAFYRRVTQAQRIADAAIIKMIRS